LGQEEVRLKDYLVYRPMPKAILALRDKPDVHRITRCSFIIKLMKVMKEGIYIGQNTTILCFVWVIMFILKSCTVTTVTLMEGFETGRPLYSTIDRYIFDLLWKGIS
jgi:hypothetical protein